MSQTRERADEQYPEFGEGSIYRQRLFDRYDKCAELIKDKIVLDIPTGTGWGFSRIASLAKIAIGIDINENALCKSYTNIQFVVGDMINIPLTYNSVDIILCLEGYEHITSHKQSIFLRNAYSILKPNGTMFLTFPCTDWKNKGSTNQYHLHEPTLTEFLYELDLLFTIKYMKEYNYWVECYLEKNEN
jgi:ubiquinone/menaquinone biosynthesis C-methylase UbiE